MNKKNCYKSLILTTVVKIENNILRYVVKIALLEAMSFESNLLKCTYQGQDLVQHLLTELDMPLSKIDIKCSIKDGN